MSLFESEKKSSTKMFITIPQEYPNTPISKGTTKGGIGDLLNGNPLTSILINAAPKLIDEGIELLSSTIKRFAEKDVTKTIVKRNIDTFNKEKISVPSSLSIIRGDFSPTLTDDGIAFGDNGKHQSTLIGHKELHIELLIKASEDKQSVCFQASKYFYNGVDREKDTIDEIVLAIAFVPVNNNIMKVETAKFQTFLHFENLKAHTKYEFGNEKEGYDGNYQSPWMRPQIDIEVPYTLVIEIQEIREGNSFAKLLQNVYGENESYIKEELEAKITYLKELNKAKESTPNEKPLSSDK